jgi:hypothetical protein
MPFFINAETNVFPFFSDRHWQMIPEHMRAQLGLTYQDDGEFYMSFRDFLRYFGELELCHLSPDAVGTADNAKKFEVFYFQGCWRRGRSAGGCGNAGTGTKAYSMYVLSMYFEQFSFGLNWMSI